jgi:hypothetical protein
MYITQCNPAKNGLKTVSIKDKLYIISWLDKSEQIADVAYLFITDTLFWKTERRKDENLPEII